jgi:putative ABC transport system permease protein
MRPPSPKQGKRVFLEHLPFIWKKLSFSKKATVRNLTRYKKRFFMTVFGIGGCMALLMVGFGLQDAIAQIVNNQYTNIWTYDVSITLDDDASLEEKENYANELLTSDENVKENQLLRLVSLNVMANDIEKSAYLYVPESIDNLDDFVILKNRLSHEKYEMSDEGVIITEKLSSLLNVDVGDTLTLKESETETYEVKILAISENYLYHYIYMTKNLYQNLYGEEPEYNQLHLKLATDSSELSRNLLSDDMAKSVSYVTDLQKKVDDMMNSLNFVVWVLILSAGLLAFVVLFNLNNINITERRRELATLKVLGFYDTEVASYVYRENVILTILGIGAGIVIGIILHQYVIRTCEIDMLMFGRRIKLRSYLYSSLLTAMFSVIVNFVMYFHLKKIDMIESLKSVE